MEKNKVPVMKKKLEQFKAEKQKIVNSKKSSLTKQNGIQNKPLSEVKQKITISKIAQKADTMSNSSKKKPVSKMVTVKEEMLCQSENSSPKEQLTMREKLERWREEKGRSQSDNVNPLLSRKRPLVGFEKKSIVTKKRKMETKGSKAGQNGEAVKQNADVVIAAKPRNTASVIDTTSLSSSSKKQFTETEGSDEAKRECEMEKAASRGIIGQKQKEIDETSGGEQTGTQMEATRETNNPAAVEIEEEVNNEVGKMRREAKDGLMEVGEDDKVDGAERCKAETRIASFSHVPSAAFASGQNKKKGKERTPHNDRRKTICLTPACTYSAKRPVVNSSKNVLRRSVAVPRPSLDVIKTPSTETARFRSGVKRFPINSVLNSAPSHRVNASTRRQRSGEPSKDSLYSERKGTCGKAPVEKEKFTTPFQRQMARIPSTSVLKSAPNRPMSSAKRGKETGHEVQETERKLFPLTPIGRCLAKVPPDSILKSAPSRALTRKSISTLNASRTPANKKQTREVGSKARRNTIHFAMEENTNAPDCIAPFTPRGEWQSKNLSIRERLDLWLAAKGNTVKKPFVVQKTPIRKQKSSPSSDDIGLNTTFTLETSDSEDKEEDAIGKRIPKMNEIEQAVVEESLKQMIGRLDQNSEYDVIKDELDLVLSTSPGVVRLASFWIIRARLAAVNGDVERVICLLEQANAFDAQPQSEIRDEVCKYLEQLKEEDVDNEGMQPNPSSDRNVESRHPRKTPAKRVTFAESQQHVVFNSSLIKFCLLECTPFRKKLKTTLVRQVLTPVRRSGRIEKAESRLPSVVRSHLPTASSPRDFETDIRDGEVFFLPNPNVDSKWNEIWAVDKTDENDEQDLSFC